MKANQSRDPAVAAYYAKVPATARATLEKLRETIRATAPGAVEAVRYGIGTFQLHGGLVGLGATKNHCALYMMSGDSLGPFQDALAKYETSKGTIRFPHDAPPPAALVKRLVKARIAENEARTKAKPATRVEANSPALAKRTR